MYRGRKIIGKSVISDDTGKALYILFEDLTFDQESNQRLEFLVQESRFYLV